MSQWSFKCKWQYVITLIGVKRILKMSMINLCWKLKIWRGKLQKWRPISKLWKLIFEWLKNNVITHSLCVFCVWILWWSQALNSWEQMVRWMTMENVTLEAAGTQYSKWMWHWHMDFCIICIMFWTCCFIIPLFNLFPFVKKWMTLFWAKAVFHTLIW